MKPSGVVTFLFTDIEGSTRRWEDDPDAMRAALASHDDTLQAAIDANEGWLFKHTGDGVCAAFTSPREAVDAAIEAQRELELPVRMGIATGEAELRGDDYFGPALNRAARVMGAGHGGQILVVAATAGLISGVELVDLGPCRLRDLSEPVEVFQIRAAGLASEFPALRTLDSIPGNLRSLPSSFVGREAEMAKLVAAVTAHRLVTLTGVGGVGKTRLALQVGAELVTDFPEGVWVVELASVGDPAVVPDAVAAALGVTQQPGLSVAESVASALEGRLRLLVFDNCEHVLDAAAELIERIFARSETVKVLATSREGLGIMDEHLWPVPSLSVREGIASTGVALFIDRARAAVPDFSATDPDEVAAVVEICRRLDGIPLAIELAASRMVSMSPADVRDRLDDRFRLLTGSRRGLERHQTLRATVQWSYDLLEPHEQTLLNRGSVFAGGFDLPAAVAVGGGDLLDEYAVLDLLDSLVRKSLLSLDRSSGRTRYAMLETIRQFAEDQLADTGDSAATRTTHARYFAAQEEPVRALFASSWHGEAFDWFDAEYANLRAAFRWAVDIGDLDTAVAIACYATWPLGFYSEQFEPTAWAEELVDIALAANHRRLVTLYAAAALCANAGRVDQALAYGEAGLSLTDDPRFDQHPYDRVALAQAYIHAGSGFDRYVEVARHALTHAADPVEIAYIRTSLATGLAFVGRTDEAISTHTGLVEAAESISDPTLVFSAHWTYGIVVQKADPVAALEASRRALEIARQSRSRWCENRALMNTARLEAADGDPQIAADYLAQVIKNLHDAGNTSTLATSLALVVVLLDRLDAHEPAATIAGYTALSPTPAAVYPEVTDAITHLEAVLGDESYDQLARRGATMQPSGVVHFALDQLEHTRADR